MTTGEGAPPFVSIEEFAELWRPLSGAEKEYGAILLLAASNWIREHKPGIRDDDPAAKTVVVEVVKAVLLPGQWSGYSSWSKTVGQRTTTATLANPAAALDFTPWLSLLGISGRARPVGNFPRNDY
ncbi:hypothetical protein Y710_16415 [Gordonia sp. QH-12]|uniref:hypothetical protein n=1 Tax=Gordonia TaxID=2053 RepID=UPI0007813A83|nr:MULTISPECIES: hypothetical protein [Gordonia]KXT55931.1 hypothetical protein Y710_16415 [Gordonia sp. QH-12]WFN94167.1 hypothetical protein P5P27_06370 [Gordonia sihwensis]WFN94228.1 hypothetical protein P5P27_06680 [Gordonia sihwensis]